uniref:RRM domain-containing protein n=1 Tax=Catharus ustulatus TaxID=91951 RepID=A0A8C3TYJ4_CATUS
MVLLQGQEDGSQPGAVGAPPLFAAQAVCCEEISACSGAVQSVYLAPHAPQQCFSLEEDDLNITSLDAETILEAEEILGTMQNYLDSSVISIIEDLSMSESKACLDAQNELSLLTAITEILDSTDDETLSPFDTIMDAELLTSPRERENSSVSWSSLTPEPMGGCSGRARGAGGILSSPFQKFLTLSCPLLDTPRVEWKVGWHRAREQPLPQRSDGEEEEEEPALSLELDSSMEAVNFCVSEAGAALEEHEDPCIINTSDVSLSELVKSMHPYCLPTFTVCLDPDTEPVAKELLNSPVLLEIVPGEGESVEIPVVLQPLTPSSPDLEPQLLGVEESTRESTTAPGASGPSSSSWHRTEAPAGGKRECSEKGRGRERARKSRKKKAEEDQSKQARPGRDFVAHRLRSTGSGQSHVQPAISRQRLERARKEGQMELHAERAPRSRGRPRSTAGAFLPKKGKQELQKEPVTETVSVALEKNKNQVPLEKTTRSVEGQPAAACPSLTDQAEGQGDVQPSAEQSSGVSQAASQLPEQGAGLEPAQSLPAAERSEGLPKEAKPKALSLREYRIRMLHRQPSTGGSHEGKKQVASKWPSVPEPPTELAEIPCLVSPMSSTTEADSAQKRPDKPTSPAAVPPPATKAPTALTSAPAPGTLLPPPSTPMPFVAPNVPPAAGVAPAGMPPASAGAYALYPPVPSWPCFSPQPMGCHGLPPPPTPSTAPAQALPAPSAAPAQPLPAPSAAPAQPQPAPSTAPAQALPAPSTAPAQALPAPSAAPAQPQPPPSAAPAQPQPAPLAAPAQPLPASSAATAQPSRVPSVVPVPQAVPTQPLQEPQIAAPNQVPKAPAAATCCPADVSPALVEDSPGTRAMEKAAGPGSEAMEKALLEPKAAAGQELPGQKSTSQAVAPPMKAGRESSLPTKAPAMRPWRHQPLLSPAQPSDSSKDIVQAFISEIGEWEGCRMLERSCSWMGHPCPQEERRVVFIGKIPSRMTRSELRHRFSVFGDIEECTLHFRSEGDNYGFVTYRYAEEAFAAIESGHKLRRPDEQPFDLCFGGRRQFCRRNYADLDSNREDFDPAPVKSKFDSLDFDTLLRQAQRSLRR